MIPKPMGKMELVELARQRFAVSEAIATEMVSWFIETMGEQIVSGGKVVLREFGTLSPKVTEPRNYNHPKTGVPMHSEGRATVGFMPSEMLLDRIRNR